MSGVELWLVELDRAPPPHAGTRLLSREERDRFGRILDPLRRARRARCRAALRLVLGDLCGVAPAALRLSATDAGAPFLVDDLGVSFSVAHGEDVGVIAVGPRGPLGVDIQLARPDLASAALARRFFARDEVEVLERLPPLLERDGFLRCWTVKEAFAKALGSSLSAVISDVVVEADPTQPLRVLRLPHEADADGWAVTELVTASGGRVALVREGVADLRRVRDVTELWEPTQSGRGSHEPPVGMNVASSP